MSHIFVQLQQLLHNYLAIRMSLLEGDYCMSHIFMQLQQLVTYGKLGWLFYIQFGDPDNLPCRLDLAPEVTGLVHVERSRTGQLLCHHILLQTYCILGMGVGIPFKTGSDTDNK